MSARTVRQLGLITRLPFAAVAALALWLVLRAPLDGAVTGLAQLLIRAYEYPKVTRLVAVDHRAEVRRADFRTGSAIPAIPLTEMHSNTIVLLALFLALPRPWSPERLQRLLMGWSLLVLCQSLNLVFHVKFLYAAGLGEWSAQHYSVVARNLYGSLRYFFDLPGRFGFPFLIWIGFNWDLLTPLLDGREEPKHPSQRRARRGRR